MKELLRIIFLNFMVMLISLSSSAHKCDSKISNKSTPCSTHLPNATINKTIAASSLKLPKSKLFEKHKNNVEEPDRDYFICPACHM